MNIDFHYGVVFMVTRLAGLDRAAAQTVAHACQYVDDATTDGLLYFSGGETFERFASAHEMVDYTNADNDRNRTVWAPFHFLPGGLGTTFQARAICRRDSPIARQAVQRAIGAGREDNGLHRLGVTLHVYIDTWAHQGFAGIVSADNVVAELTSDDIEPDGWLDSLKGKIEHWFDVGSTVVLSKLLPLGHGAALHYPDLPWARWHYINGHGERVDRDNPADFLAAADMAARAVRGFITGNEDYVALPGLHADQQAALLQLIHENRDVNPLHRLAFLSQALSADRMPGLAEDIPAYIAKGPGSWKATATGIDARDDGDARPDWSQAFESSNYRKFHDAVKEHRYDVTQKILPAHQLRLA